MIYKDCSNFKNFQGCRQVHAAARIAVSRHSSGRGASAFPVCLKLKLFQLPRCRSQRLCTALGGYLWRSHGSEGREYGNDVGSATGENGNCTKLVGMYRLYVLFSSDVCTVSGCRMVMVLDGCTCLPLQHQLALVIFLFFGHSWYVAKTMGPPMQTCW